MSQHIYRTKSQAGASVEVLLGWDPLLQRFFLVVETMQQAESDDDEYLYSNLADKEADGQPLSYFMAKLAGLGIGVPQSMLVQVAADAARNVGNRRVLHIAEGEFSELSPER